MDTNKIVVILGPTCTGKTSLAISLCQELNGEIVSADSRQIYKHMDVGTGKQPPKDKNNKVSKGEGFWEIDKIKVRGYDLVLPNVNYTVYDYARFSRAEIESIIRRKKIPFLVGGTGFYIDVVLGKAVISGIKPNPKIRNSLEKITLQELILKLKSLDPKRADNIDIKNRVRIIRAIEVALSKPQKNPILKSLSFPISPIFIGLTSGRNNLYKNSDIWADSLFDNGIINEANLLINKGYKGERPLNGLVYDQILKLLNNETTQQEALKRIKFDLHAYIRRQLTWFNRNSEVKWFDSDDPNLCAKVKSYIQS